MSEKEIWKFPLPVGGKITLGMPAGAVCLTVQMQHGVPCVWALVEPLNKKEPRRFILHGTGHPFNGKEGKYIGTFQMEEGMLVFHLFEEL